MIIDIEHDKIMEDISERSCGNWDNLNYTDKVITVLVSRILKEEFSKCLPMIKKLSEIPIESLENERLNKKQ